MDRRAFPRIRLGVSACLLGGADTTPAAEAGERHIRALMTALAVEDYATGKPSLTRAIGILRAHAARHPDIGLEWQAYLYPYPDELRCEEY